MTNARRMCLFWLTFCLAFSIRATFVFWRAVVCDCGTPWTFLLPFFFVYCFLCHKTFCYLRGLCSLDRYISIPLSNKPRLQDNTSFIYITTSETCSLVCCSSSLFTRRWFHMSRLLCQYFFLISPFGALGRLRVLIRGMCWYLATERGNRI